jgi:hypothetical protein
MSQLDHPMSPRNLDTSPFWTLAIEPEIGKLQLRPVQTN